MKTNRHSTIRGEGFFYKILFAAFCIELILGGGGHLIDIGGFSLRMFIFFAVIFVFVLDAFVFRKVFVLPSYLKVYILSSLMIFVFWGLFVGLGVSGNTLSFVLGDSNAWLYPLIFIPFYQWAVRYKWKPEFIVTLVISLTTVLALITDIAFLIMLYLPRSVVMVHNFFNQVGNALGNDMYVGLMPDGFLRVMWINSLFLLPSLAFIFFLFMKLHKKETVFKKVLLFVTFFVNILALFATYSRGLWLGFIAFLLIGFILVKNKRTIVILLASIFLVFVFFVGNINLFNILMRRLASSFSISDVGNAIKVAEIKALLNSITESPLLGHGFGYVSPYFVRGLRNPYSYEVFIFDITMKIGLVGDFLIIFMFCYITKSLIRIRRAFIKKTLYLGANMVSLVFATLIGVLVVGLPNPFLNSSVGFGIIGLLILCIGSFEHNIAEKT